MKILRMLVITLFLLTTIVTSAAAQSPAASTTAGFIPLLTQVDPNFPIEMQTEAAFRAVVPQLLAAQKRGDILAFEPELSFGILKIQYRTGFDIAQLKAGDVYSRINAAVAKVPLSDSMKRENVSSVVPNGLIPTPVFDLELYNDCFDVYNLPASSRVVGNLKDTTGREVANYEGNADASGNLNDCFNWNGPYADVIPGYRAIFKLYDLSDVQIGVYSVYAPAITFTSIDKANSIAKGTGTANKAFDITWIHPRLDSGNTVLKVDKTGTISSSGTWSVDFGTTPFRGDDEITIDQNLNVNFYFSRYMDVPYIFCVLGSAYCGIYGFAFKPASLTIVHGGVAYPITGKFDAYGYFSIELTNGSGVPIFLKAGDKVSGTSVAQYALPSMTIAVNFGTDVVSGKIPPSHYFRLSVYTALPSNWYDWWVHSNSLGNYSKDTTSWVDLKQNKATTVEIDYQNPYTGNFTYFSVPFAP
jgi:hypothetical protein